MIILRGTCDIKLFMNNNMSNFAPKWLAKKPEKAEILYLKTSDTGEIKNENIELKMI